ALFVSHLALRLSALCISNGGLLFTDQKSILHPFSLPPHYFSPSLSLSLSHPLSLSLSISLSLSLSLSLSTLPPSFMLSLQNSHSISSLFFLLSYSQALSLSAKKAALMMHKAYQLCMHTHTQTHTLKAESTHTQS